MFAAIIFNGATQGRWKKRNCFKSSYDETLACLTRLPAQNAAFHQRKKRVLHFFFQDI